MRLSDYQKAAVSTAIYPAAAHIFYPALGLAGEAGETCDKIKKVYRDDNGVVTSDKREALKKELGDCLWYLAALASDLGLDLGDIAQANIDKLLSRKERGTLQGSGDNR